MLLPCCRPPPPHCPRAGEKVDELTGADPRRLEQLVTDVAAKAQAMGTGMKLGGDGGAATGSGGDDSAEERRRRMAAAAEARFAKAVQ